MAAELRAKIVQTLQPVPILTTVPPVQTVPPVPPVPPVPSVPSKSNWKNIWIVIGIVFGLVIIWGVIALFIFKNTKRK